MNESSIFLLNKKKGKYEFDYPENLYVDTCFWNEAYGTSNSIANKLECKTFLEECVSNGTTLFTSGIIREEMQHVVKKSIIDKTINENKINFNNYRRNDRSIDNKRLFDDIIEAKPEIVDNIDRETDKILNVIDSTSYLLEYTDNIEFSSEVRNLNKQFCFKINTYDLRHAVITHLYGINDIATRDGDYWLFDNMNNYTPSSSNLSIYRLGRRNVKLKFDENKY